MRRMAQARRWAIRLNCVPWEQSLALGARTPLWVGSVKTECWPPGGCGGHRWLYQDRAGAAASTTATPSPFSHAQPAYRMGRAVRTSADNLETLDAATGRAAAGRGQFVWYQRHQCPSDCCSSRRREDRWRVVTRGGCRSREQERPLHLLILAAKSATALTGLVARYRVLVHTQPALSLGDLCYAASVGRSLFSQRLAIVAASPAELDARLLAVQWQEEGADILRGTAAQHPPRLAFLFTGQGAQYVEMGRELYDEQRHLPCCARPLRGPVPGVYGGIAAGGALPGAGCRWRTAGRQH